jgi:hypothetical protein
MNGEKVFKSLIRRNLDKNVAKNVLIIFRLDMLESIYRQSFAKSDCIHTFQLFFFQIIIVESL